MGDEKVKFRGGWTCQCVATSLPLVEAEMVAKGIIKHSIDIFQMGWNSGGVSASAGTHDKGGCVDVGQYSDAALRIWREWGWTQQHRTPAQGFSHHGHGFPKGCPHMSSGANYQASEWEAGRNGLRSRGPITGPGPKGSSTPTRKQAIKNHGGFSSPSPTPPTPPEPGGILGMTSPIFINYSPKQQIKAGDFVDVGINDKGHSTILGENKSVTATAVLRVSDLVEGDWAEVTWRLVEIDSKGNTSVKTTRLPVTVLGVPGRKQNESITFNGAVPKNQRLRASVKTNAAKCIIDQIQVQGWKA